jgi:CDP-glucose 4,6-dehydratase
LEGHDPYSASKVAAESVVRAWQQISEIAGGPKVVSVRAGNVIGGGDFAKNRLIPDIIRSYVSGQALIIRNPNNTRPWQHVLDPLRGYVNALEAVLSGKNLSAVNFGPQEESLSVRSVIEIASKFLDFSFVANESSQTIESRNLNLDSSQALSALNWEPIYDQETAINTTVQWWTIAMQNKTSLIELCKSEIELYLQQLNGNTPN